MSRHRDRVTSTPFFAARGSRRFTEGLGQQTGRDVTMVPFSVALLYERGATPWPSGTLSANA